MLVSIWRSTQLAVALSIVVGPGAAAAAAEPSPAELIEQYAATLPVLQGQDEAGRAADEMVAYRAALARARNLVHEQKPAELQIVMSELEVGLQTLRALVDLGRAERQAVEQRSLADALEKQIAALRQEKSRLEERGGSPEGSAPRPGAKGGTASPTGNTPAPAGKAKD